MQSLQQELWRLEGPRVQTHVGDLAWWGHRRSPRRRLWLDGARCVAWAWLTPPSMLDHEVHPDHRGGAIHRELVEWFEREAEAAPLTAYALEGDEGFLLERGYSPTGSAYMYLRADLRKPVDEPRVDGFTLHTVGGEDDFRKRVEIHRAVWAPSRVTEDIYRRVTQTWPYRADLDCVAETRDGSFAAYALCWYDDANRVGELEPVGTHPDYRRLGLGAAVCRYALHRVQAAGATMAIVYAKDTPARALYESVGFELHTRALELRKERP
jgi:GNAT superfamily N-acetyltransferase